MTQARVVLIGGGYVSIWAARALRRWARRRVDVTIVAPEPAHSFHGWTGDVIAGDLPVQAGWTPLSEAARETRVLAGTVERVDRSTRTVHVRTPDGRTSVLSYDHLVVGSGTADHTDSVPGLADWAHTVRSVADVQRLLRVVDGLCWPRRADHAESAVVRPRTGSAARIAAGTRGRAGHTIRGLDAPVADGIDTRPWGAGVRLSGTREPAIVVVGGGVAGVELAGALARRVGAGIVTLVQRSEHIGADLAADHAGLGRRMRADLAQVGVTIRTGSALARVESDHVELADGETLPADVVVAACGTRARALPGLDDLPTDPAGRMVTDDRLRVSDGIWAGGDAACVPFVRGGSCPASALWAITHGTRIGRSIARVTRGRQPGRYRFVGIGRAASLGPGRGYVELRGVPMTGWLAWLVRLLFFLRYTPSGRQALRVAQWWLAVPRRALGAAAVGGAQPSRDTDGPPAPTRLAPVAAAARATVEGMRRPA